MMKLCDVKKRVVVGASVLLAGLAMAACAVEEAPADEAGDDPIAEVELANGSRVTFLEPTPGSIAIDEQSAIGVAPLDVSGMSPLEVYRSIAPGQPVPERLAAAQARADEARRDRPVREVPEKPASKGDLSSITATDFYFTYCLDPYYSNINCHLGPNQTGVKVELDGTHVDVDEFRTTLCVNSGKVRFRVWVEEEERLDVQLYGGSCWTRHWVSGTWNADYFRVRTDILSETANYFLTVKWNN